MDKNEYLLIARKIHSNTFPTNTEVETLLKNYCIDMGKNKDEIEIVLPTFIYYSHLTDALSKIADYFDKKFNIINIYNKDNHFITNLLNN